MKMIGKIIKVAFILLSLILLTTLVEADTPILKNLSFKTYPEKTEIIFEFDQPANMVFYTVDEPFQIIADVVGDALALSSTVPMKIAIDHAMVKEVKVFKEPSLGNDDFYGVDFFIINLKEEVAYAVSQDNNVCNLYIAASKATPLSQLEPQPIKPEPIREEIKIETEIITWKEEAVEPSVQELKEPKGIELQSKMKIESEILGGIAPPAFFTEDSILLARQWRSRGYNYQKLRDYKKAAQSYERAKELDLNYTCVYNDLGIIYYYLGMFDEAISEFKEAIRLDATYLGAYSNLAIIYEEIDDDEKAIECWQMRVKLSQKDDSWTQEAERKLKELKGRQLPF